MVKSQLAFSVRTTPSYWALITTIKHPSLIGREAEVIQTLRTPEHVRRSRVDEAVYLFYRKIGQRYLCVVTKKAKARTAFIVTAYVTDKIKEGRVVWKK